MKKFTNKLQKVDGEKPSKYMIVETLKCDFSKGTMKIGLFMLKDFA